MSEGKDENRRRREGRHEPDQSRRRGRAEGTGGGRGREGEERRREEDVGRVQAAVALWECLGWAIGKGCPLEERCAWQKSPLHCIQAMLRTEWVGWGGDSLSVNVQIWRIAAGQRLLASNTS